MTPAGHRETTQPVPPAWLHDTLGLSHLGSVRMVGDGTDLAIVSSRDTRVRITVLRAAGTVPWDVDLLGLPRFPGWFGWR